jgi:cytochrome c556
VILPGHQHHLQDERLFECYLSARAGDLVDPPTAEHLADCASCHERYADLVRLMESVRDEGQAEADAVFTPERLRAQQQQIVRRVEQVGRPARVISFPGQLVRRTITASAGRTAPRWIAAAAAAGIFIGVALGASYQLNPLMHSARQQMAKSADPTRLTPVATRGSSPADVAEDDAFLSDLEVALERPHTRELLAFDAFTPHVREVHDRR